MINHGGYVSRLVQTISVNTITSLKLKCNEGGNFQKRIHAYLHFCFDAYNMNTLTSIKNASPINLLFLGNGINS